MIRFLQTKGRLQQVLLVGFLSIICIMMVVTLIPGGSSISDYFGGMGENVVAKVGGVNITSQEVQEQARNMARQQFPQAPPDRVIPFIIPRVAEMLVSQRVVLSEPERSLSSSTTPKGAMCSRKR